MPQQELQTLFATLGAYFALLFRALARFVGEPGAVESEGEEAVSPKSPAQQMVRRMSSLGTAARTSAGSFSKFRRAMSMRSTESPLSGGGDE